LTYPTPETAPKLAAIISPAVVAVVVKSVTVELVTFVPVEIATPLVLMEFEEVGIAVPVAIFHVLIVAVPASTVMLQLPSPVQV
jgi:hypothetical protein